MPEGVLGLALDRGPAGRTEQLLACELVKAVSHLACIETAHLDERPGPEDLADHRRVLEQRLPLLWKRVEARLDQRLDGLRNRDLCLSRDQIPRGPATDQHAAIDEHPDELLRVQGVPSRSRQQGRLGLGREDRPVQERGDQLRGLLGRERRQRDGSVVPLAAAPGGCPLVQLGPRRAKDEQRHPARPVR